MEEYSLLLDEYLGGKNKVVYNHMLLPRELQIFIDEHKLLNKNQKACHWYILYLFDGSQDFVKLVEKSDMILTMQ